MRFYIGTYTTRHGGGSEGIYSAEFCPESGEISDIRLAAETDNPSFLAFHPTRSLLYAVSELGEGAEGPLGSVSAFEMDPDTGGLTHIGTERVNGTAPCHLVVDATGGYVLAASYGSGSVCTLPVLENGGVGPIASFVQHEGSSVNPARQEAAHAHSINLDADNRFALVCDLGTDMTYVYRFDSADGSLTPNDPAGVAAPAGAGPRHLAFHPNGRYVFVINELDSTMGAYAYDANAGALRELQTLSTLPEGWSGDTTCADVHVDSAGRFVYGSNRGHDSIVTFAIDDATAGLELVGHESTQGETPRNFAIAPGGQYLLAANQDSDSIAVLRRDAETGALSATGRPIEIPSPVCVLFAD